jgi:hypothetical protein
LAIWIGADPTRPEAPVTAFEYQPLLGLASVWLMPQAETLIGTSPGAGLGTGQSA